MGQLGEFPATGHLGGEFFQGDLGPLLVQHPATEFEDDEVVPDKVGVVRVVGDEHHPETGIATVYQDLAVDGLMEVWRNFFLGSEIRKGKFPLAPLDIKAMREIADTEL